MEKTYLIQGRKPEALFHYFEELSAIPRGSGNESAVADYLCEFAASHGLYCYRDAIHNVLIRKGATPGYENRPPLMLQGHTDMVCEKNADVAHDFEKDPLELELNGPYLSAKGTTLGGDDGIAVAMMLAALSDETLAHPELECLFTVQEETGLTGAYQFDYSRVHARRVLNLDSENEKEAVGGCAGGARTAMRLPYETVPFAGRALKISITGLAGGHSGEDVTRGRRNANIMMGRLLGALYDREPFNLIAVSGGNKDNAIPRECEAVIAVRDREDAERYLRELASALHREMTEDDRHLSVRLNKAPEAETMMTFRSTGRVIAMISLAMNGILSRCAANPELVESSTNLGSVRTDGEAVTCVFLDRSSVEPVMDDILLRHRQLAHLLGAECTHSDRYPGWAFIKDTPMQKLYLDSARAVFGNAFEPRVVSIHAGLECGIILSRLGDGADAVSVGPVMHDIHTPFERLDLDSVERTWRLVRTMIEA